MEENNYNSENVNVQPSYTPEPQPYTAPESQKPENLKKGLGITGIVLGALSILCCSCLGAGIIFSIVGMIFSIVAIVKGTGSGKTLGIIGAVLNGIGLLLNLYMIVTFVAMINWDNVTVENLNTINRIDPNNQEEVRHWLQQFFRVDISSYR